MGRVQTDVTKPATDNVDVYAGLEKVDCRRVPPGVWRNVATISGRARGLDTGGEPAHPLVDSKACQRIPGSGYENSSIGI